MHYGPRPCITLRDHLERELVSKLISVRALLRLAISKPLLATEWSFILGSYADASRSFEANFLESLGHNFDYRGDLLALVHYRAGVRPLSASHKTAPFNGEVWRKTPNFPEAYFPNAYEAKWHTSPTDGETYLLVTERGSGLYVLKMDDAPAP